MRWAFERSLVQIPAARPKLVLLPTLGTSETSSNGVTVTTGPKISSDWTLMLGSVSVSTVGSTK